MAIISVVLLILEIIIKSNTISIFINEMSYILSVIVSNLAQAEFTSLSIYLNYSLSSWLLIINMSFFLASLYKMRIERQAKLENIGVKEMHKEIKDLQKEAENNKSIENKKNGVFIGIDEATKKQVYSNYNSKHILVGGTTGSGKTTLLANYILDAVKNNYGLVIVDVKGDTGEKSILDITKKFCNKYNRKLIVVDMNSPSTSNRYNPFRNTNETICKDMLVDLTDWSEQHYKVNTERYLQRLIKLMILNNIDLSLKSITEHMFKDEFLKLSTDLEKSKIITKNEHLLNLSILKACEEIATNAAARFANLSESSIGEIFNNEMSYSIASALEENAIILFVLNPLEYPLLSSSFGRLILQDAKRTVSELFKKQNKKKVFYIFDEINVYVSSVLINIVNKSRSANITNILALQSLADIDAVADESFKHQLIENCNNYFVMRQNSFKDADEWSKTLGTVETMKMTYQLTDNQDDIQTVGKGSMRKTREFKAHPDDIKNLPTGEAFYLSHDDNNFFAKIKVNYPL